MPLITTETLQTVHSSLQSMSSVIASGLSETFKSCFTAGTETRMDLAVEAIALSTFVLSPDHFICVKTKSVR